jgi:hypothetical protein
MTSETGHGNEYDPALPARPGPIWGEGFTVPGGPAAVDAVVERS